MAKNLPVQGPLHPDRLKSDALSSAPMLLVMRSFPRTLRIQNSSITATCQLLFFLRGQRKRVQKVVSGFQSDLLQSL